MLRFEIRNFDSPDFHVREAVNTLCTNLSFSGDGYKRIMLTSCQPSEGKSFVSMNMLRTFAQLGMRTVLVDCDLRTSQLQSRYKILVQSDTPNFRYPGMSRYLAGKCSQEDILGATSIPNAWMILSGRNVSNSLPLLSTAKLKKLLDDLAEQFDMILVDAPPIGTIIDAARISSACDGTLFVVESGAISRSRLSSALKLIARSGSPLLGTVLNQYDDRLASNKYYSASSYYNHYNDDSAHIKDRTKKKR